MKHNSIRFFIVFRELISLTEPFSNVMSLRVGTQVL